MVGVPALPLQFVHAGIQSQSTTFGIVEKILVSAEMAQLK